MGEVLLFEPSLFCIEQEDYGPRMQARALYHMKQIERSWPKFYHSLISVKINKKKNQSKNQDTSPIDKFWLNCDIVTDHTENKDYVGISGWNTKMNHGFPATAGRHVIISRDITINNNDRNRLITARKPFHYHFEIYAANDLKAGTELVLNYSPVFDFSKDKLDDNSDSNSTPLQDFKAQLKHINVPCDKTTLPTNDESFLKTYYQNMFQYIQLRLKEINNDSNGNGNGNGMLQLEINLKSKRKLIKFFNSKESMQFKKHAFANGGISSDLIEFTKFKQALWGHNNLDTFQLDCKLLFGVNSNVMNKTYNLLSLARFCNGCHKFTDRNYKPKNSEITPIIAKPVTFCSKCFSAFYCSHECFVKDIRNHSTYCKHRQMSNYVEPQKFADNVNRSRLTRVEYRYRYGQAMINVLVATVACLVAWIVFVST